MNSQALKNLLDAIGSKEAPKGYGQIYGGARGVPLGVDVSRMKLKDVRALQEKMLAHGSASTACGRYQFIRKTLNATMTELALSGEEVWTPALQDRMAVHLLQKRGLKKYLAGQIGADTFANNLAMEWASLPVVTTIEGAHRKLKPGQSYYAGDGLNKSHHDPLVILELVRALRQPEVSPPAAPVQPPPRPDPSTPIIPRESVSFWAWLKGWFS